MSIIDAYRQVSAWLAVDRAERRRCPGPEESLALALTTRARGDSPAIGDPGDPQDAANTPPNTGGGGGPGGGDTDPDDPGGGGPFSEIDPIAWDIALHAAAQSADLQNGGNSYAVAGGQISPDPWFDDFADGIINLAAYNLEGTWAESAGQIAKTVTGSGPGRLRSHVLYKAGLWEDTHVEIQVLANLGASPNVFLRADSPTSPANYYTVEIRSGTGLRIARGDAGVETVLATDAGVIIATGDIIAARMVGTTLTAYLNGVAVGSVVDATYAQGYAGFATPSTGSSPSFTDLSIYAP